VWHYFQRREKAREEAGEIGGGGKVFGINGLGSKLEKRRGAKRKRQRTAFEQSGHPRLIGPFRTIAKTAQPTSFLLCLSYVSLPTRRGDTGSEVMVPCKC